MKEISIKDIEGYRIGNAQNFEAATGCTVVLCDGGACAGLDVRGGGPASRETQLMNPLAACQSIDAVLLAGGSAFGLDAAGGVQKYLEERGIGYDVGITKVPLVCQADIFDLGVGDFRVRPDAEMAYQACVNAETYNYCDGNFGAGTGASAGKMRGIKYAMKTGIGSYAVQLGDLKLGAIVVVNALGDIYDHMSAEKIAGVLNDNKNDFLDGTYLMYSRFDKEESFTGNTTLAVIMCNAKLDKSQLCKVAGMAHDGYARAIKPVHTSADGDSIYALANGTLEISTDLVGTLAADVVCEAIKRAVTSADSAYGLKGHCELFHV